MRSLTDPPAANETVTANVSLISLQGNAVDVTPYITDYNQGINNFTRDDYGRQFDVMIKTRGEHCDQSMKSLHANASCSKQKMLTACLHLAHINLCNGTEQADASSCRVE